MSDEYDEESDSYKPPNQREVPERRVPEYPRMTDAELAAEAARLQAERRMWEEAGRKELETLGKITDALGIEAAARVLRMNDAMKKGGVKSTYTVDSLATLIARVQERGALYTERGMDPLKVEALLDDVFLALREMQAIVALADQES